MPQKVTPFLWLPGRLSEAVEFYTSVFPDGEVIDRTVQDGELYIATFRAGGIEFAAMNAEGGPPFSEAISFVVLCEDLVSERDLDAIAACMSRAVRRPIRVFEDEGEGDVTVGLSIGSAMSSGQESAADLLKLADAAMYAAKAR